LQDPPEIHYKEMTPKEAVEALMIKEPNSEILRYLKREGLLRQILYSDSEEDGASVRKRRRGEKEEISSTGTPNNKPPISIESTPSSTTVRTWVSKLKPTTTNTQQVYKKSLTEPLSGVSRNEKKTGENRNYQKSSAPGLDYDDYRQEFGSSFKDTKKSQQPVDDDFDRFRTLFIFRSLLNIFSLALSNRCSKR
jgi:hypothetical protein